MKKNKTTKTPKDKKVRMEHKTDILLSRRTRMASSEEFIAAVQTDTQPDRQPVPGRSDIFQWKRWEQSVGRSSPIRWRKWVMNSNMVAARLWWMR